MRQSERFGHDRFAELRKETLPIWRKAEYINSRVLNVLSTQCVTDVRSQTQYPVSLQFLSRTSDDCPADSDGRAACADADSQLQVPALLYDNESTVRMDWPTSADWTIVSESTSSPFIEAFQHALATQ